MLSRYPLFRILFFYISGILTGKILSVDTGIAVAGYLLVSGFTFFISSKLLSGRLSRTAMVCLPVFFFAAAGLIAFTVNRFPADIELSREEKNLVAVVTHTPRKHAATFSVESRIIGERKDSCLVNKDFGVIIYFRGQPQPPHLVPGDLLVLKGRLESIEPPKNPGQFDYSSYMSSKGIVGRTFCRSGNLVKAGRSGRLKLRRWSSLLQGKLERKIESFGLNIREASVLKAILIGWRSDLDRDVKGKFASAGAMHILAVSGLHVGILYLLLRLVLQPLERIPKGKWLVSFLIVGGIWVYAFVSGLSPSVSRAATMFTFVSIGTLLQRDTNIYNTLIASALFLLIIQPNLLFSLGFQLSYAAVLGIVSLQPVIYGLVNFQNLWILDKLWSLLSVSIAAQVGTLPLTLYYFHQFPVWFLITNTIVIPLTWFIMFYGLLMLILSFFISTPELLLNILKGAVSLLNEAVSFIEGWKFSVWKIYSFSPVSLVLLSFVIFFAILILIKPVKRGFFIFIALLCVFFLNVIREEYQGSRLTVFSIPGHKAMAWNAPGSKVLIADHALLADPSLMDYHGLGYWNQSSGFHPQVIPWNEQTHLKQGGLCINGPMVQVRDLKIFWPGESQNFGELPFSPDLWITSGMDTRLHKGSTLLYTGHSDRVWYHGPEQDDSLVHFLKDSAYVHFFENDP